MAEKRMFAKTVVLSDAFLEMPMSARCLYFTLGMFADDDGFVNSPRMIMRLCGATDDDAKLLIAKRFLIAFDSGVIVLKHWKINNYIPKDRYHPTKYQEEFGKLLVNANGSYTEKEAIHSKPDTACIQDVYKLDTENRLDEIRLDEIRLDENIVPQEERVRFKPNQLKDEFEVLWMNYPRKDGKKNAFLAYERARHQGATYDDVMQGIKRYVNKIEHEGTNPEFIAMGSTWFNQRRWEDECKVNENKKTSTQQNDSFNGYGDADDFFKLAMEAGLKGE